MKARSKCFIVIIVLVLVFGSSAAAVDYSNAAHIGIEPAAGGGILLTPGVDLRMIGGRGLFASRTSIDYLNTNSRGYNAAAGGNLFVLSTYALLQASIMYGDLTFYTGPGTSLYFFPSDDIYGSFTNDNLFHWTLGIAYALYPLNFFVEAETDINYLTWNLGLTAPRVKVGVGLMN